MLEHLFGSKTRYRMLKMFFRDPEKIFYVRELTRALETQINAVRRELGVLLEAGLVVETTVGKETGIKTPKKKYYKLHSGALIYPELKALLLKDSMGSEQAFLQKLKDRGGDLKFMLITGMLTGVKGAPTDLFLVGTIKERVLAKLVESYEKEFGKELRYTFMTPEEFHERRHVMDKFVFDLFEYDHVKVVNELGI